MLTNTVILFLREMLPLAILLVFLLAHSWPNIYRFKYSLPLCLSIVLGCIALINIAPSLSELFAGAGLEISIATLLFIACTFLLVGSCLAISSHSDKMSYCILLLLGTSILSSIKSTNFVIYLIGYLHQGGSNYSLLLGLVIAIGICTSFAILLYFSLTWLISRDYQKLLAILWSLFIVGQLCFIVPLLAQVDLINDANIIWDSSHWVKDSSEYGHMLNAMMGYEATPSDSYLFFYFISLVCCFGLFLLTKTFSSTAKSLSSGEEFS